VGLPAVTKANAWVVCRVTSTWARPSDSARSVTVPLNCVPNAPLAQRLATPA
jgi:hypothetical protein